MRSAEQVQKYYCFVIERVGPRLYRPPIILPSAVEEKKNMEMDAYLDHFKTSIFLRGQRRFVKYGRAHRGPSKVSCRGPGNR